MQANAKRCFTFFTQNRFITNVKHKVELLHSLFNKQCFLIKNNSNIQLTIFLKTDISLTNVTFNEQGIENFLLNINPNKAHGHIMINIRLLQICGKSINKPLGIIYKSSSEKVCFSSEWEKANVIPVKKKGYKERFKNYRPISLLSTQAKI